MTARIRFIDRLVWVGFGLTAALLVLVMLLAALRWRAGSAKPLPVYGQVAPFALTNEEGVATSLDTLKGRVWIADIIFTRCAGPCLKMSRQMKELQQALPAKSQTRLVTLTTDPGYDSPAVLKTYAQRFGADTSRWMFLTGTKQQIGRLASDSLKLSALEKSPGERQSPVDLFIHSTILVLVDKQARLRGVYETTGDQVQPEEVKTELLAAVRQLERER